MNIRYRVDLSEAERKQLKDMLSGGKWIGARLAIVCLPFRWGHGPATDRGCGSGRPSG